MSTGGLFNLVLIITIFCLDEKPVLINVTTLENKCE